MKLLDKTGLTFDDVCLVPVFNNVASRDEPSLCTSLSTGIISDIPIINSPMSTVIGPRLAVEISQMGGVPLFHRFSDPDCLRDNIEEYAKNSTEPFMISIGTKSDYEFAHMMVLSNNFPFLKGVCIDVAHGHSNTVIDLIKKIKDWNGYMSVIAGNVCTARGVADLALAGADAIRVGIGPGSNCSTRMVTGFGSPQFTALVECSEEASRYDVPIISDGGIRDSRDIVIALAAGASSVMVGRLYAQTEESAGTKSKATGRPEVLYKGQASKEFQREGMAPEGVERWLPVLGSAKDVISNLLAGVRSGFTYAGARTIEELQRKAVFMPVSNTYMKESVPRD